MKVKTKNNMKKALKIKSLMKIGLLLFAVILMLSCSSDSNSTSNQNTISGVVNNSTTGSWRITYFYDTDHEETSNYTGYNFTFGSGNVITAVNGTNTYTGTWSVTDSNSNDDNINDLHYIILFTTPTFMEDLSDDWEIISYSSTEIKLTDVSGGNGGTDFLTFTKN